MTTTTPLCHSRDDATDLLEVSRKTITLEEYVARLLRDA